MGNIYVFSRKVFLILFSIFIYAIGKTQQTDAYTSGNTSWVVPAGVTSITVRAWGGGGAGSATTYGASGGSGAFMKGTLTVTPGQTLYIVVGGGGISASTSSANGGGGASGSGGGSGGGYSGVFLTSASQANARVIAGGGGGGGYYSTAASYGGAGGATTGTSAGTIVTGYTNGGGGSTSAGGTGGQYNTSGNVRNGTAGTALQGGAGNSGYTYSGGGGGGGYYGGGGGYGSSNLTYWSSAGGGGASYYNSTYFTLTTNTVGTTSTTGATCQAPGNSETGYVAGSGNGGAYNGASGGSGLVLLTYTLPACTAPNAPTALTFPSVGYTTINGSFTASTPSPTGYIVVRSTGAIAAPTDGTTYTTGTSALGGYIVTGNATIVTSTTFADSGLTSGTSYNYKIFAYNNTSCTGGPKYSLALSGTQSTLSCGSYSGTMAVGPTGTFTNLTDAISKLTSCGYTGNIVLELQSTYTSSGETFPITFTSTIGSSSTKTITIRPAAGASPTISGSVASNGIIVLNGSNYITIDGSNSGGTTRDLTISNSSTSGTGILFMNGSSNNVVKNSKINAVPSSSATYKGVVTFYTASASSGNNNNVVQNNAIAPPSTTLPYSGIYNNGTSATYPNTGNSIIGNDIYDFSYAGVYDYDFSSGSIYDGNNIYGTQNQTSTTELSGINLLGNTKSIYSPTIKNNKIYSLKTTYTNTTYGFLTGINIYDISSGTTANVYNNMISLSGNGAGAPGVRISGISDESTAGTCNIYYNSVYIYGSASSSTGSYAFLKNYTDTTIVKNNIFVNVRQTSGTGSQYAIAWTGSGSFTSDYNDIYSSGNSKNILSSYNSSDYATLATWQTATSQDANSLNMLPSFSSYAVGNLHIVSSGCDALESAGTPIPGITTDIDSDTRSVTLPDIGADEFSGINPKITGVTPGSTCGAGTVSLSATGTGTGFKWYAAATGGSALSTSNPYTPSISSTTTYYVTATNGSCESSTRTPVLATVNPTPTAILLSPASASVCPGSITTITASGGNITGVTKTVASGVVNLSIPDYSSTGVTQNLVVSGIPAGATITKVDVKFNLTHAWLTDAEIVLKAPNGKYIALAADQGPSGTGSYTNTIITSDTSAATLSTTATPITGTYKANATVAANLIGSFGTNLTSTFSDLFTTANGTWSVIAYDDNGADTGTLVDAQITITYDVANAITWSPITYLYTDSGATTAYVAGNYAATVYVKPTSVPTPNPTVYTATATNGLCSVQATTSITVKTPVAITSATAATSPICSNATTTLTANGVVGTNAVVTWYSGTGATGTNFGTGTTLPNAAPGTYYAYVTGDCGTPAEASVTVGSIALPTASITGNNGPICSGNNAVFNLSGTSGAVVTYNINGGSNTTVTLVGGTATVTLTGVTASQTLNLVSVDNGTCTATLSGNSTVSLTTTIWNGTSWSNGVPASNKSIEFQGNYTSSGNLQACSCTVTSGTVTISSGNNVTLLNDIKVNGGSITFKSGSNLLQTNNVANTGNIIVERDASTPSTQYSYWSSPVSGQYIRYIYNGSNTSGASNAPYILYYNTLDDKFYNVASTLAVAGMGYAVKGKPGVTSGSYTATFTGVPNNGNITYYNKTLSSTSTSLRTDGNGYNLVGNPYPSNLDLNVLYDENKTTSTGNIGPNFWLWDYVGNTTYGQVGSGYIGSNYGVYNAPSGTGNIASNSGKTPDGYVFVGQGFIVKALGTNQGLKFNNGSSMRTTTTSTTTYQKSAASSTDRYWLKIVSPIGNYHTTAVVYKAGAQNILDDYDSEALNIGSDDIYSLVDTRYVNINGRAPFNVSDVVPLGVSTFQTGNYTISLDGVEGVFNGGQSIYLHDKQSGTYTDLTQGNYTFSISATGINTGRFEVVYVPDGTLGINITEKSKLLVYRLGDNFIVKSDKKITSLELYDASGRMMRVIQPNKEEATIEGATLPQGIYLIRINRQGEVVTQKVRK